MRIRSKKSQRFPKLVRIMATLFGLLGVMFVVGCALHGDFNGDRYPDLAVGIPSKELGNLKDAGAVHFIYGSQTGLSDKDNWMMQQPSDPLMPIVKSGKFGGALAVGNFDGRGWSDLAVGIPNQLVGSAKVAGAVYVVYHQDEQEGSLPFAPNQFWYQGKEDSNGLIVDPHEEKDHFGSPLAAGNFNGDAYSDLVVGVPYEGVSTPSGIREGAGAVHILYGSFDGLTTAGNHFWTQGFVLGDPAEEDDRFGWALAVGDFNGDDYDDLAVGVPHENVGFATDAGAVHVVYGSKDGLSVFSKTQQWHQGNLGVQAIAEDDDRFGWALAAGDFNGDAWDDLAVGVPGRIVSGATAAGGVYILYGSQDGLSAGASTQLWHQDSADGNGVVEDEAQPNDRFGYALAAGDFNGDGFFDDLAVGVPFEDIGSVEGAGAVNVLYGSTEGLSTAGNQFWYQGKQDSSGMIEGFAEKSETFGRTLAVGNFNWDSSDDLVVGVPSDETAGGSWPTGAVNVLYGSKNGGLSSKGNQHWHHGLPALGQINELHDFFGQALGQ